MNILYLTLSSNNVHPIQLADYMSDLLWHGLRELYGETVVEIPEKLHMYKPYPEKDRLWGRGFSYSEMLDRTDVDRTDIENKIRSGFFKLVVLSVHHTIHTQPALLYSTLGQVRNLNPDQKIAVVDGHDTTSTYNNALDYTPYLFKREIPDGREDLIPIHFAIPKDKVRKDLDNKDQYIAKIVPCDHSHPNRVTHCYTNERDYYDDYARSYFSVACKKGGFDSERTYEIMANGSICLWTDIENCPENTMTNLPKKLFSDIKNYDFLNLPKKTFDKNEIDLDWNYIIEEKFDKQFCLDMCGYMLEYARDNLTTERLAKYFLEKVS